MNPWKIKKLQNAELKQNKVNSKNQKQVDHLKQVIYIQVIHRYNRVAQQRVQLRGRNLMGLIRTKFRPVRFKNIRGEILNLEIYLTHGRIKDLVLKVLEIKT